MRRRSISTVCIHCRKPLLTREEMAEEICAGCYAKILDFDKRPDPGLPVLHECPPEGRMRFMPTNTGTTITSIPIDYREARKCR